MKDHSAPDLESVLAQALDWADKGDVAQAGALMREALGHPQAAPTPIQTAMCAALELVPRMNQGHYHEVLPAVLPLLADIERSDHADRVDWLYTAIGFALGNLGDPERGLEWTARALALTELDPRSVGRRKAFNAQGCLLGMLEQHDPSMNALEHALDIAQWQGFLKPQATCLGNLSFSCLEHLWKLGEAVEVRDNEAIARRALDFAERARAIATEIQDDYLIGFASNNCAGALLRLGQSQAALSALREAAPCTSPYKNLQCESSLAMAMALRQLGDLQAARQALDAAESLARAEHFELVLGRVLDEGMRLESAAGDPAAALAWAQRNVAFLKQHYPNRLKMVARSAELFAQAERTRREALALHQQSKAWEDAALRDTLTGCFNRRGLARHAQAPFHSGQSLSLAAFDADRFKRINDRFGHAIGDAVLIALPRIISAQTRDGDVLARIGGEEFVLLLCGAEPTVALASCERIRLAIERHDWAVICPELVVTVSVGLASRSSGESLETLIAQADAALYQAKRAGRNRVRVAGP